MLAASPSRRPTWVDLLLAAGFVAWFYAPFLPPGLPLGDFPSAVAVAAIEDRLVPSPLALPTWDPWTMCGKPTIEFASPFRVLALPFAGLDPIDRMKALVVLFHVLGALAMYGLVRASAGGGDAALLAAMAYPVMPAHVSRTVVHGHVQLPMFWALLPLVVLALLRIRRLRDPRAVAVLALALAACLVRDRQRALLTVVMLGLLLGAGALRDRRARTLLAALAIAFAVAVAIDAFELVNGWEGDPWRAGHDPALQAGQLAHYALDDVYTFLDPGGRLGAALAKVGPGFHRSLGRYLGLGLFSLVLWGALDPAALGPSRRRFWLALLLLPLSTWLAFGPRPLAVAAGRWLQVLASPAVTLPGKTALVLVLLVILGLAVLIAYRNLPAARGRLTLALGLVTAGLALPLLVAPLPLLVRACFFLGQVRNPEWFSIAVASFAVAFPAGLALGGLGRRFGGRPWWGVLHAALVAAVLLDFLPYRRQLTGQRPPAVIAALAEGCRPIAGDPDDFRVAPVEGNVPLADICFLWHGKRLAWDFRDYTAPRGTSAWMRRVFDRLPAAPEEAARLAGIANVKYLVDVIGAPPDLAASPALELVSRNRALAVFRNRRFRRFVSGGDEAGPAIEAGWSRPEPERIEVSVRVPPGAASLVVIAESYHPWWQAWVDGEPAVIEPVHDDAFLGLRLTPGAHRVVFLFRRPASYRGWGVLSLLALAATALVATARRRPAADSLPAD